MFSKQGQSKAIVNTLLWQKWSSPCGTLAIKIIRCFTAFCYCCDFFKSKGKNHRTATQDILHLNKLITETYKPLYPISLLIIPNSHTQFEPNIGRRLEKSPENWFCYISIKGGQTDYNRALATSSGVLVVINLIPTDSDMESR